MRTEPMVLIVERDCHARELESCFLREAGLDVEVVADGKTAWDKMLELKPALVLSDILVPKMDGLALCRRIKADPATSHVPVLVTSVLAAASRAHEAGADGFLAKPISQERFLGEVMRLLPRTAENARERA